MDLKITGTVQQILEEQSGTSKNGPWRKQDFILKTGGEYPKPVCITQWGDNIDKFDVKEGEEITAYIDIQSREYNDRWYTDVKAWRIDKGDSGQDPRPQPEDHGSVVDLPEDDDDLPF